MIFVESVTLFLVIAAVIASFATFEKQKELIAMAKAAFEELKELVTHSTTVQNAAVDLLRKLADQLTDLANHPSATDIRALATEIRSHAAELGAAIALHGKKDEEEEEKDDD